jgi:hypothetical protein
VPDNHLSLVVMVYWGNHWVILIADRLNGKIYYLDFDEIPERRQMAISLLRNFVNLHLGDNNIMWSESDKRSLQQTNTYDCEVWAILNTWAWMERGDTPVDVRLTDRLHIGRIIVNAAQVVDQTLLPPLTNEVEYIGIRNLRAQSPIKTPVPPTPSPAPRLKGMVSLSLKT